MNPHTDSDPSAQIFLGCRAVAHRAAAIVIVVVASRHRRRRRAINVLESIRGHPILVWGSPFRFGDPQTKTGIVRLASIAVGDHWSF